MLKVLYNIHDLQFNSMKIADTLFKLKLYGLGRDKLENFNIHRQKLNLNRKQT
jgi:hypothetical protein